MNDSILSVRGISKRFGAVQALKDVSVEVRRATVHALIGENGAGKSTLGKIIVGSYKADSGELEYEGEVRSFHSPRDALSAGIAAISQEVSVIPERSVLQNVFLGAELSNSVRMLATKEMRDRFDELVAETGLRLPPDAMVGTLSTSEQHQVEIMRALARKSQLLVMDEPSAALGQVETTQLHRIVRSLVARGTTVIYVSHFLDEILELAEEITILRNGELVKTTQASSETSSKLVEAMLGRSLSAAFPPKRPAPPDAPVRLAVRRMTRLPKVHDVSLDVRAGEIVGLFGLVGSGRSELARLIFGADKRDEGEIEVAGAAVRATSPRGAVKGGIAFLPENRARDGLIMDSSLIRNTSICHLEEVSRAGWIDRTRRRRLSRSVLQKAHVQPLQLGYTMHSFSGGNQQKALFAKWLFKTPSTFIADEPTRGVDVGAKFAIYTMLTDLAAEGLAILMISSEIEEIIGLSHRAIVMRRGRVAGEFAGASLTEDNLLHAAFGTITTRLPSGQGRDDG